MREIFPVWISYAVRYCRWWSQLLRDFQVSLLANIPVEDVEGNVELFPTLVLQAELILATK